MKRFFKALINRIKKIKLINILFLTIAGIINSVGVTLFLFPAGLLDSGLSGTSLLLDQVTPSYLTFSMFLIILNFPFYILAIKKIGGQFLFYSLYAIAIYSLGSFIFKEVINFNFDTNGSPIAGKDLLLCSLFGGLLSGIGSGLTIRYGGALDGVEVMAVLFAKKLSITVGTFVMAYNVILYTSSAIVFESWTVPLYSIISYYIGIKTIDLLVEGLDKAKQVMIITAKPDEICHALSEQFGRGLTLINGKGYYSKQEKTIIYCVANRFEISSIKKTINAIDENAFITITETSETMDRRKKSWKKYRIKDNEEIKEGMSDVVFVENNESEEKISDSTNQEITTETSENNQK